jgi:hypothetical protein
MADFLIGLLGFSTFLVIYFWIFSVFAFGAFFERFDWYWDISKERRQSIPFLATVLGGVGIWLSWEYVLPDWWKSATPLMSYE